VRVTRHTDEHGVFTKKNSANSGGPSMRIRTRLMFFWRRLAGAASEASELEAKGVLLPEMHSEGW